MRVLFPWHINRSCANLSDFFMRCANCAIVQSVTFGGQSERLSMFEHVWAFTSFICSWIGLNRIESGVGHATVLITRHSQHDDLVQSTLPIPPQSTSRQSRWNRSFACTPEWFDVVWCGLWCKVDTYRINQKKHPFWWAGGPQRRSYLWRSRNQSLAT